jgi:uncharacterized membrane protein
LCSAQAARGADRPSAGLKPACQTGTPARASGTDARYHVFDQTFSIRNWLASPLGGTAGGGAAINDSGQIAGTSTQSTTQPTGGRAVRWDSGGITNLTPALGPSDYSVASGFNDTGEIVGTPFI